MLIIGITITLLLIWLVYKGSSKVSTESTYLVADRNISCFALTATLVMTELNPSTLIAFSSLGYHAGWWALCLPFVFLSGLLFYAFVVAKKWKEFNGFSVTEFFHQRYGPSMGRFASTCLFLAMLGFSATYVKSLAMFYQAWFGALSPWLVSGLIVGLCLLTTLRGGLAAIVRLDVVSFVAVVILFGLLCGYTWVYTGQVDLAQWLNSFPAKEVQLALPPQYVFSLIILTMFTYILAPWYGQKIFAAHSVRTAFTATICAAILVFILYGLGIFATSLLKTDAIVLQNHEMALPYIVQNLMPSGVRLGWNIVMFFIGATTLCGVWSAMSAILVTEFCEKKSTASYQRSFNFTLLVALLSYILANTLVDNILQNLILANIPVAALSFSLLAGFYWKKVTRLGAISSVIVGLIWGIFCYLYWGNAGGYTWFWAVYGVPLIFATGIITSCISVNNITNTRYWANNIN